MAMGDPVAAERNYLPGMNAHTRHAPGLRTTLLLLAIAVYGCAASGPPAPAPPPAAAAPTLPGSLVWVQRSAEYRALAHQAYALAQEHLRDTVPTLSGAAWGVILDADETVLDNSEYQRRRAVLGSGYTSESWAAWVREAAAPAVPGAVTFVQRVHAMGGRVVIVTNRADGLCGPTRDNLARLGVVPDVVLCQPPGESDKNPRFRRVQDGTAAPDLPALTVVEWIGDNIQDFPGLSQATRGDEGAFARFGHAYFVIPNPMYGSWQGNGA
jgi:5'-nucleotidase (lipoprotein e(P4) family)